MGATTVELLTVGQTMSLNLLNPVIPAYVKVTNKSPYDVQYSGFGVYGLDWLAAGTEYMLSGKVNSSGSLNLTAFNNTNVSPQQPGAVLITVYDANEPLPQGHWPVSIPFQTVQGSSTVTQANSVVNDGNSPGTTFISAQPSDVVGVNPTVTINNDGSILISGDNAGVLTQLLKLVAGASPEVILAASNVLTLLQGTFQTRQYAGIQASPQSNIALQVETNSASQSGVVIFPNNATPTAKLLSILNNVFAHVFDVDYLGNITVSGASSLDNGNIATNGSGQLNFLAPGEVSPGQCIYVDTGGQLHITGLSSTGAFPNHISLDDSVGSQQAFVDTSAFHVSNKLTLPSGSIIAVKFGHATGINGVVVTHGLGRTPAAIAILPDIAQPGSATTGVGNVGSTTFEGTCGAGTGFYWIAIA